jgi:hypothetical protein
MVNDKRHDDKPGVASKINWVVVAVGVIIGLWVIDAFAQNSDPAGGWTTCKHINSGKTIVVDGPRCPNGWMKVY